MSNTLETLSSTAIPGPRPMPLLGGYGNLLQIASNPMRYMHKWHQTYGKLVTLAQGSTQLIFAFDPQYNQQVLSNVNLFYVNELNSIPILPNNNTTKRLSFGLHAINGPKHKQHRRLIMPNFHKNQLEIYYNDIITLTEQHLTSWQPDQQRDLHQEMKQLTMAIGIKTLLGLDPEWEGKVLGQHIERFMSLLFSIPVLFFPFNIPGVPYYRYLKEAKVLETELQNMIERKRANGSGTNDVLSLLIQAHNKDNSYLNETDLIGHALTIFRGAYPSTTLTIAWTLFLLSQHPAQLANLLDELKGSLHGAAPTFKQLNQLPLLEGAINESMRLLPPALWLSRFSTAPFKMGPYNLPQGTQVVVSPFITHRLPELYSQPNKFILERWLTIKPSAYEYLPFSAGQRLCVGATFAMMIMKSVLAIILQRYNFSPVPGAKIDCGGVRGPELKQGLPMVLTPQNVKFKRQIVTGNIHALVDLA